MKNNILAYKVVKVVDEQLCSAIVTKEASVGKGQVVYSTNGSLVKPNKNQNPFLFIFETYQDAKDFFARYPKKIRSQIWEVRANNVRDRVKGVDNIWEMSPIYKSIYYPQGTLFCSSLRMIKRIE